jgi:hypothetical protein
VPPTVAAPAIVPAAAPVLPPAAIVPAVQPAANAGNQCLFRLFVFILYVIGGFGVLGGFGGPPPPPPTPQEVIENLRDELQQANYEREEEKKWVC